MPIARSGPVSLGDAIPPIYRFLFALAIVCAAVIICYFWLDRPIALWVHKFLPTGRGRQIMQPLGRYPNPVILLSVGVFVLLGLRAIARAKPLRIEMIALCCTISVLMGEQVKTALKWIFGRAWPESWRGNNPSFVQDHVYGFHWFQGGGLYDSFPSGHMTAVAAALSVLWIYYPRSRMLYVITFFSVAIGLVGLNLHFLGDVVAGVFVGVTVGWMCVALFNALSLAPDIPNSRTRNRGHNAES